MRHRYWQAAFAALLILGATKAKAQYCTPAPLSVDLNGISGVEFGTVANYTTSESGNYGDYTNLASLHNAGDTVTLSVLLDTDESIYDVWVWLDWNLDGDYEDVDEATYLGANDTLVTGAVIIPSGASGNYRMRIGSASTYVGLGTTWVSGLGKHHSCYDGSWGAFEDYSLNVGNSTPNPIYCVPAPTSVDNLGITGVAYGDVGNFTVAESGNYGNYTSYSSGFNAGDSVDITVLLNTGYAYDVWAWVDWNLDGDFEDAGEANYLGQEIDTLINTIVIPSTVINFDYRMRIGAGAQGFLGTPNSVSYPCYSNTLAAFEDYTLTVDSIERIPTVNGLALSYCTPGPESVDDEGITGVEFGTVANFTSDESDNYGDYTNMSSFHIPGESLFIEVSLNTDGYDYNVWAWLDWNSDGDYEDAGEAYYLGEDDGTVIGTVAIPTNAVPGTYRLRIGGADSGLGDENDGDEDPCYTDDWGAFEDYALVIGNPPTCPSPTNLTTTVINENSIEFAWSSSSTPEYYLVEYGDLGFVPGSNDADDTLWVMGDTSMIINSAYELPNKDFYVTAICGGGDSSFIAGPINPFSTEPSGYCLPSTGYSGLGIVNVAFGTVNNSTGKEPGDYGNFSYLKTDVEAETMMEIEVKTQNTGNRGEVWAWIDWNKNQDFEDDGEWTYIGSLTGAYLNTFTSSIYMPWNVDTGYYQMRIGVTYRNAWDDIPTTPSSSCGTGKEAFEDYTIHLVDPNATCYSPANLTVSGVSNSSIDLTWQTKAPSGYQVIEYGAAGFVHGTGDTVRAYNTTSATVSNLNNNTDYDFLIYSFCGSGDTALVQSTTSGTTLIGVPYAQPFPEFKSYGDPDGWSNYGEFFNGSTVNGFYITTNGAGYHMKRETNEHTGDPDNVYGAAAYFKESMYTPHSYLESPEIELTGSVNPMVSFYVLKNNILYPDADHTLKIEVWDGTSWNVEATYQGNNPNWVRVDADVSGYSGTIKIRVHNDISNLSGMESSYNSQVLIDDIMIYETPPALAPNFLIVDSVAPYGVNISWPSMGSQYLVEYGYKGFEKGTGTVMLVNDSAALLAGLDTNTFYEACVRTITGTGDTSEYSDVIDFFTGYRPVGGYSYSFSSAIEYGITHVDFGQISNTTTGNLSPNRDTNFYYENYQNMVTYHNAGDSLDVSIVSDRSSNLWMWIDWNGDFDYYDEGEAYYFGTSSTSDTNRLSIQIPVGASGDVGVRFGIGYAYFTTAPSFPDLYGNPCWVEDYTLHVGAPPATGPFVNDAGCVECDQANVGDFFVLDGDSIEVVDRTRLLEIIAAEGDLTKVCVSHVEDMKNLFLGADWFNQDISNWDVSNVITMRAMFKAAKIFNQDISNWDVSSVTDFTETFNRAAAFNQNINSWDVSSGELFSRMFILATNMNQPLNNWDVSNASRMTEMFKDAYSFSQDLSGWCVSQFLYYNIPLNFETGSDLTSGQLPIWGTCSKSYEVTALATGAFVNADSCIDCSALNVGDYFELNGDTLLVVDRPMLDSLAGVNADLSKVCVSHITDMTDALRGLSWFNADITKWDVSNVTNMSNMFFKAFIFNQDISNWNVSNVTNFSRMFQRTLSFNQDISDWDVSNAERMNGTFRTAKAFNQNISTWDVSNVFTMDDMFRAASNFDQDLSSWCVTLIPSRPSGFETNSSMAATDLPLWGTCNTGSNFVSQQDIDGVEESTLSNENTAFTLFPNPTNGKVIIAPVMEGTFTLYSPIGKVIDEGAIRSAYDLSDQPNGMYLMKIQTRFGTQHIRIVKQ